MALNDAQRTTDFVLLSRPLSKVSRQMSTGPADVAVVLQEIERRLAGVPSVRLVVEHGREQRDAAVRPDAQPSNSLTSLRRATLPRSSSPSLE